MIGALATRAAAALLLAVATPAAAQTFPARTGESGLLDVPNGEVMPLSNGLLAAELRYDAVASGRGEFGPLPFYAVAGFWDHVELGFSMREWGQPGDPRPARMLFGGAMKLQLVPPTLTMPAIAVDATVDRLNGGAVYGSRLIASSPAGAPVRWAGYAGFEAGGASGFTYGGAVGLPIGKTREIVLEALGGPRGPNVGAAVRWLASPTIGLSAGVNYLPSDEGLRVSVGIAFGPTRKRAPDSGKAAAVATPDPEAETTGPTAIAFRDERPRFRLRIKSGDPTAGEPRSLRHGPWLASAAGAAIQGPAKPAPAAPAAAPSVDDVAEAQLHEQESLADARDRRLHGTAEQLDLRGKAALEAAGALDERDRELAGRERQLDAREARSPAGGAAGAQQQQLASTQAQLAAQERQLAAQERSLTPALDAAVGRVRESAAREDAERQDASRLAAAVKGAPTRALQLELRKQALAARNRQLAATESRLVATSERIDAVEQQLRTRTERLAAWQRRLDARAELLDLLDRRTDGALAGPEPGPRPEELATDVRAQKDKAVFAMVVKSPTTIVKGSAATPGGAAAAGASGEAVEKVVSTATVVSFPSPASQLSELDREAVEAIAALAAREQCELLVWARASKPSLVTEAQRRAAEMKSRLLASARQLADAQVVTRVTTRPGADGVDLVVSAMRETARRRSDAAAPGLGAASPGASALASETGKRQLREAVEAARPFIESCLSAALQRSTASRAEVILSLTVSPTGRVLAIQSRGDGAGGAPLEACLSKASAGWRFPASTAEYAVEVPITLFRGGAAR